MLQTDERGVDGSLVEEDFVARDLLDAAGDAVAVLRPHGGEGLQDHEVEGSLEEVNLGFTGCGKTSLGRVYRQFLGVQRLGLYIFLRLARCFQPFFGVSCASAT